MIENFFLCRTNMRVQLFSAWLPALVFKFANFKKRANFRTDYEYNMSNYSSNQLFVDNRAHNLFLANFCPHFLANLCSRAV